MWRRWLGCRSLSAQDGCLYLSYSRLLRGIVCSTREGSWDGYVGSDGPGISCSGGDKIPKCCCIGLRMAVCWVWVAIS